MAVERAVHPRSRGEQHRTRSDFGRGRGSSPLTRGTGRARAAVTDYGRFIPAHAGNSPGRTLGSVRGAVHPRSRGEQACPQLDTPTAVGSSPLTRGTGRLRTLSRQICRFIPAHAGNRRISSLSRRSRSVHPRSRGEQGRSERRVGTIRGSSPLTRGTGPADGDVCRAGRFIPAHAGNSTAPRPPTPRATVHPRSRGEQHAEPAIRSTHRGSSPLTRGTGSRRPGTAPCRRFIPAHAGNRTRSAHRAT